MSENAVAKIRDYLEKGMQAWQVPGATICLVHKGETILSEAFGLRNIDSGEPTERETVFWIASNTKAMAALSLALLVDEGRLDWDEPIRTYVPTLRMATRQLTENVSVRDLLSHRTGLPGSYDWFMRNPAFNRRDIFDRLRYMEPNKGFRTTFQYNNLMYALAGFLLEEITGRGWEDFVADRIFRPLGIETYDFNYLRPASYPSLSPCYAQTPEGIQRFPVPASWEREVWAPAPAGGVNTNIIEIEKWLRLQLGGGKIDGNTIVSKSVLDDTYAPHIPVSRDAPIRGLSHSSAGLGWWTSYHRGIRKVSHGGALGSYVAFLPEEEIGFAILTNLSSPLRQALAAYAFDLLLGFEPSPWIELFREQQDQMDRKATEGAEARKIRKIEGTRGSFSAQELSGLYTSPLGGDITLSAPNGELEAAVFGTRLKLEHLHYDTYVARMPYPPAEIYVTFNRDLRGGVGGMTTVAEGLETDYARVGR